MTTWTINPTKFATETKEKHRSMVAFVGLDLQRRLVNKTPVDTGRASSNWIPSVGAPAQFSTLNTSQSVALANAARTFSDTKLPYFPTLYVANNVDYIVDLNRGTSKQAPKHFVEIAIEEASRYVV